MTKIFFCFPTIIFFQSVLLAGDDEEITPRVLAQRIASAREQIVAYRVEIEVKSSIDRIDQEGNVISQADGKQQMVDKYYFEFSRLEEHFICAKARRIGGWDLQGQSEGIGLGCSGFNLAVSGELENERIFFDPLATGLLRCEQFVAFSGFEDQLLQLPQIYDSGAVVEKAPDGVIVLKNRNFKLMIDSKRGYWPIYNEHLDSFNHPRLRELGQDKVEKTCSQQLTVVNKLYVPSKTSMSCLENRNEGKKRIEMSFKWIDVNTPIPTGADAAQPIAAKLNLNFGKK